MRVIMCQSLMACFHCFSMMAKPSRGWMFLFFWDHAEGFEVSNFLDGGV